MSPDIQKIWQDKILGHIGMNVAREYSMSKYIIGITQPTAIQQPCTKKTTTEIY